MKILYVINNLGSGGAEKLIEETLPLLNKINDIQVDILLLTNKNNVFSKNLEKNGVNIKTISLKNIYNPLNIVKIKKHIDEGKYNIVHSHLFPSNYWVAFSKLLTKDRRVKFITTEHSNNNGRRSKPYLRILEKYVYAKYDKIICISDRVYTNLYEWLKPHKKNISKFIIVNNGININKYKNAQPYKKKDIKDVFNDETDLICMVGRFSEAKDHSTLIKSISYLPNNIHLLLIGEGSLMEENIKLAKSLNIYSQVHFLGFRDDVEKILKTSDIAVLSSHWEGLSLASIEAMASGKPLIASKVDGLEEIVGGYGILFDQGDYKKLSQIIKKLLRNDNFYKRISDRCISRAEDFNIDVMIESIVSIYRDL